MVIGVIIDSLTQEKKSLAPDKHPEWLAQVSKKLRGNSHSPLPPSTLAFYPAGLTIGCYRANRLLQD